jgi:hypothetical protein
MRELIEWTRGVTASARRPSGGWISGLQDYTWRRLTAAFAKPNHQIDVDCGLGLPRFHCGTFSAKPANARAHRVDARRNCQRARAGPAAVGYPGYRTTRGSGLQPLSLNRITRSTRRLWPRPSSVSLLPAAHFRRSPQMRELIEWTRGVIASARRPSVGWISGLHDYT